MKRKLKIAIFHCGFIYSGGGERIVLEEARGLKARGYDVLVYAPTLDPKKCYPAMIEELDVKTFFPTFIDKLLIRNALRMVLASLFAPLMAIGFKDVDVFVGANQPGAWIAYMMAKVLKKPYVVYLNQPNRIVYPRLVDKKYGWYTTVKDYQFLYRFFRLIWPLIAWLDKASVVCSKYLLVNGGYIGGIIKNIYAKETVDAPAGSYAYQLDKLSSDFAFRGTIKIGGKTIKKPYALITNRHDPQKRFDFVIKALKEVVKDYPAASLVIPGPFTAHSPFLVRLAKKLKIEDKVLFLGQIPEEQLQNLYKNCAVYCYPSPEEDFGLGPLEAGGWGVPTVAWKHGGPTVTVEDGVTGFLAKPYDIGDYADKMSKLFKDRKLRQKMGLAAWRRTKEIFSWERHVDVLEKAVLEAMKGKRL